MIAVSRTDSRIVRETVHGPTLPLPAGYWFERRDWEAGFWMRRMDNPEAARFFPDPLTEQVTEEMLDWATAVNSRLGGGDPRREFDWLLD